MNDNRVVVTDIDMPFGRMVVFILKLMLASIPAVILFYFLIALLMLIVASIFGGAFAVFGN